MKEIPCDLCGSDNYTVLWQTRDLLLGIDDRTFRICRCAQCGLVFINPQPEAHELAPYYGGNYSDHISPRGSAAGAIRNMMLARHARRILRRLPPRPAVLEIGCGDGSFLRYFKEAGAECTGIEMRGEAAEHAARAHGLNVIFSTLEEASLPEAAFDLVILRHVIEHVPGPTATMRLITCSLRPGGLLILMAPDFGHSLARLFGDAWCGLDVPRHLFTFNKATMRRLLDKSGFAVESLSGSLLPNDWVYSLRLLAAKRRWPEAAVNFFRLDNLFLMGLFAPVSLLQGLLGDSGRMEVAARKSRVAE